MRKHVDWKRAASGLLILVVLLASVAGGAAYAKYVTDVKLNQNKVTINASLGTIELIEHKAVRLVNGDYDLLDDTAYAVGTEQHQHVTANAYILLPGLDIPKDPFVRITGKTTIEAYVFVEVVGELDDDSGITYSLTADWTKLENVTGAHDGTVYVYKAAITNTFGDKGNGDIQILKDNTVYVSQYLDKSVKDLTLTFYACMYETASGSDAASVYANNTTTNP